MELMCKSAVAKNLKGLAFTDHLELELVYPGEDRDLDLDLYFEKIFEMKAIFGNQLDIYSGIEITLSESVLKGAQKICQNRPLDIIIGSVHGVDGVDVGYPAYFEGKTKHEAYERYLKQIWDMAVRFQDYSVIGHIGYISRYAPYREKELELKEHADILDSIFNKVIETGHGLELNTSGLEKLGTTTPSVDLLKRYRQLGGEIVTAASDAHAPERVGKGFDKALAECMKRAGFRYVAHYQGLKPVLTPIE
jgi:histidinol-phosphatase (PHP family)